MRSERRDWILTMDDATVLAGDEQGRPDGPVIVLLHGLASNLRWWDPVAARLALRHRVVRVDHRGHGRSGGPAAGYTVQRLVADTAAVLDRLGLDRVVLAGHSAGADVALAVAAAHADRVVAVGCVDGGVYHPRLLLGDTWPDARRRMVNNSPASTSRAVLAAWLRGSTNLPREALDAVAANYIDDGQGGLRRRLRVAHQEELAYSLWRRDPADVLAAVRAPIVLLAAHGGADTPYPPRAQSIRLVQARVGDRLRVTWVPGGHDLPLEQPAVVGDALADLTASVGSLV
jgi:pimeloyl-ACP methyl ester carboxylesterase